MDQERAAKRAWRAPVLRRMPVSQKILDAAIPEQPHEAPRRKSAEAA